ncbi:MAG: hypothetical protein FJ213_08665 [Ignavibacteria bacterium]|nr:hypothetical protein [Ignavibacteria bacterium]
MRSLFNNLKFRIPFFVGAGAAIGYAYYYFIGCYSGNCPITSTWYVSTLYGGAAGLLIGFPNKKK